MARSRTVTLIAGTSGEVTGKLPEHAQQLLDLRVGTATR
jgi:hypothetical protein